MKHVFLTLLAAAALVFAGCDPITNAGTKSVKDVDPSTLDNKTDHCWNYIIRSTVNGKKDQVEHYAWCTEQELVTDLQAAVKMIESEYKSQGIKSYTVESYYKQANAKTEEACDKLEKGESGGGGGSGGGGEGGGGGSGEGGEGGGGGGSGEGGEGGGGGEGGDDNTYYCWHIEAYYAGTQIIDGYRWATGAQIKAAADNYASYGYQTKYSKTNLSEEACYEAEDGGGGSGGGGEGGGGGSGGGEEETDYNEHCFEIWCMYSDTQRHSEYVWWAEYRVKQYVKAMQSQTGLIYHYTRREQNTVEACNQLISIEGDPKPDNGEGKYDNNGVLACWREDIEGQITYKWCYEYFVKANCNAYKSMGYDASYSKTSINDEYSCNNAHD